MADNGGLIVDSLTLNRVIGLIAEWDKSDRVAALDYAAGRISADKLARSIPNAPYMKQRAEHAVQLLALLGLDEKYTRRAVADAQERRGLNG